MLIHKRYPVSKIYGLTHILQKGILTLILSCRLLSVSAQLAALKCQMRCWIKEIHLQCINPTVGLGNAPPIYPITA